MNTTLLFEFSVDKDNKEIHVEREFAADLPEVWDAWTKPELLDQWWAPKPWQTRTKSMDFRVGGSWIYAMVSPENVTLMCRVDFKKIAEQQSFAVLNGSCSEDGAFNQVIPLMRWNNLFSQEGDNTMVKVVIQLDELSDLEKIISMGFKEGFTMALSNLDEFFKSKSA